MTQAALSLGANLGEPRRALVEALAGLDGHPCTRLVSVSGLWRTAPVGGPEQPEYSNAVVIVDTELRPTDLLDLAHGLEKSAGRVRAVRWGPRTLDVDILDMVGISSDDPDLTLPHPRAHERAFVLVPWAEIAPDWALTPAGGPMRPVAEWVDVVLGSGQTQDVARVEGGPWWR